MAGRAGMAIGLDVVSLLAAEDAKGERMARTEMGDSAGSTG